MPVLVGADRRELVDHAVAGEVPASLGDLALPELRGRLEEAVHLLVHGADAVHPLLGRDVFT